VLGLNSIEEVTVNTTSYAVDQGRYGASQINYITKSGSNTAATATCTNCGTVALNASQFLYDATAGNRKPRSTVNHFGGSLSGPVKRDKLFFFGDFEQMRIALPIVNTVTLPSTAFQSYVLGQLPKGGVDTVSGTAYPAAPALVPFYTKMSRSIEHGWNGAAGAGMSLQLGWRRGRGLPAQRNGCAIRHTTSQSSADHEQVITARADQNIDIDNMVWYRLQSDTDCRRPTRTRSTRCSTPFPRSRYTHSPPDTHTFSARTC